MTMLYYLPLYKMCFALVSKSHPWQYSKCFYTTWLVKLLTINSYFYPRPVNSCSRQLQCTAYGSTEPMYVGVGCFVARQFEMVLYTIEL